MKPQPQDWTQLADIHAVRAPHGKQPIAPVTLAWPPRRALATPPLLAMALYLCWLAAQHASQQLPAALLGAGVALALLLPITLFLRRQTRALVTEVAAAQRQLANI